MVPHTQSGSLQVPPDVTDPGGHLHLNSVILNVLWPGSGLLILGPQARALSGCGAPPCRSFHPAFSPNTHTCLLFRVNLGIRLFSSIKKRKVGTGTATKLNINPKSSDAKFNGFLNLAASQV